MLEVQAQESYQCAEVSSGLEARGLNPRMLYKCVDLVLSAPRTSYAAVIEHKVTGGLGYNRVAKDSAKEADAEYLQNALERMDHQFGAAKAGQFGVLKSCPRPLDRSSYLDHSLYHNPPVPLLG